MAFLEYLWMGFLYVSLLMIAVVFAGISTYWGFFFCLYFFG